MFARVLDIVFPAQCAGCRRSGSGFCETCAAQSSPVVHRTQTLCVTALGTYDGALRAAVLAIKDGRADVASAVATRIGALLDRPVALVPVPTTAARRRIRGRDGVVTMAREIAASTDASALCALRCVGGGQQRGRGRTERLSARNRFEVVSSIVDGMEVALLDDVCTTGTTLEDCASALRRAGAVVTQAFVAAVANREA